MKSILRISTVLAGISLFGACAPLSPLIKLNPTAPTSVPTVKNRPAIYLMVQDSRPGPSLGMLPARQGEKPVHAKAAVPVEDVVRQAVTEGLTKAGFTILGEPTATSPQLVVQVKKLQFKMETGPTWSEITGMGSLSASGIVGTATRSKTYNAENGKKWAFSPPSDGHEKYLNLLLTDLLNAFLTDETFLSFLATGQ